MNRFNGFHRYGPLANR